MQIDINPSRKYIDVWLGSKEAPPDLDALRTLFQGFEIVIWHSGIGDLAALTAALLQNNK